VSLRRYYVLFFITHASRRVWLAGCSPNPTGAWVTQQRRNLGLDLADERMRFLIRDRDSKYAATFDEVFGSGGIRIVRTPVRAPQANAIAERFVRTVRAECLDWLLIVNCRHLDRVLRVFIEHYNVYRPHRALKLRPPHLESHRRCQPPGQSPFRSDSRSTAARTATEGLLATLGAGPGAAYDTAMRWRLRAIASSICA
jgi:hypothetical protein